MDISWRIVRASAIPSILVFILFLVISGADADDPYEENDEPADAAAIEPGGYLVYTGQPWHPQLEMIARALTSHRQGQAWVMRRRTQQEMDQLVEAAGFTKIEQRMDEFGIFTVSLARRNGL